MADSKEIEAELHAMEQPLLKLVSELEIASAEFYDALPAKAEAWIREHMAKVVQEDADRITAMADIKPLKLAIDQKISALPALCNSLRPQGKWRMDHARTVYGVGNRQDHQSALLHAFRTAVSSIGSVLRHFSLDRSRWETEEDGKSIYSASLSLSDWEVTRRYEALVTSFIRLESQINSKKQQLTKAKAAELWNS